MDTEKKIIRIYDPHGQKPVDFYDSKTAKEEEERMSTLTYNHRVFNNWVKSVLIDKYSNKIKNQYKLEWD